MDNYTYHVPPPCFETVDVLHADEHLLVVNKPSGLLSVPGRFVKDCALNRLIFDYPDAAIVHRLDLDTSGILVFSRSKLATSDINRQFRERTVKKEYYAVVHGLVPEDKGAITLAIAPDPVNRPKQLIDAVNGKSALTHFEVVQRGDNWTYVLLKPVTGRSHQLRIHMASIGHPILGCDLYAHQTAFEASKRLCLHAAKITFSHPASGDEVEFSCPAKILAPFLD